MECFRSERFKIERRNLFEGPQPRLRNLKTQHEPSASSAHAKQQQPSQCKSNFCHYLHPFLRNLYAGILFTCEIVKLFFQTLYSFWDFVTCQFSQKPNYNTCSYSWNCGWEYILDKLSIIWNWIWNGENNELSQKRVSDSGTLYSSDDEDAEDWDKLILISSSQGGGTSDPVLDSVIDDEELPFVSIADTIFYYFNLYQLNYPAFTQEFSASLSNWLLPAGSKGGCDDNDKKWMGKKSYGHNLDPSKWRKTCILKKGFDILKRRELRDRMSRVSDNGHQEWILKIALTSRLIILLLQMLCRNLPKTLYHNNDGFKFIPEETYGKPLDSLVNNTLGGFVNWDANYFLHISVYGYTKDNFLAFFPLLPMVLFVPSRIAYAILGYFISLSSLVIIFAVVLNTWLFVKCAKNIYQLASLWSGESNPFISTACLMFIFNSASIFFSGLYTETLFAYLTSQVILSLFERDYWSSILCAAISGLCRSNGILNIGFVLALLLQTVMLRQHETLMERTINFVARSVLYSVIALVPFYLFQAFAVMKFCDESIVYEPGSVPLYCINILEKGWTLPYSYVQKKYWDVGFMNYFQLKQIPNFILGFPALYILGTESYKALKLSFLQLQTLSTAGVIYYSSQALHGLFLTVFCFFFVHVQVSTRMIMAACPYLYIFVADTHLVELEMFRTRKISLPLSSLALILWCSLYYFIGTFGFCLGLPWT